MKPKHSLDSLNFLDFIPVHSQKFHVETSNEGKVTVFVENKGFFNRIAQVLFAKPVYSQIHLEDFGNFIWPLIDGNRSVRQIADLVHEHFGTESEPLYPRISMYFRMLKDYQLVILKNSYTWE